MTLQIVDMNGDFALERQFFSVPTGFPHYTRVSPEDPQAPNKANYIWANAIGKRERFKLVDMQAEFVGDSCVSYIHQFAYNGTAVDNVPGLKIDALLVGDVSRGSVTVNVNSVGVDKVGQVKFDFVPWLTRAEYDGASIRHETVDAGGSGPPDDPEFEE